MVERVINLFFYFGEIQDFTGLFQIFLNEVNTSTFLRL